LPSLRLERIFLVFSGRSVDNRALDLANQGICRHLEIVSAWNKMANLSKEKVLGNGNVAESLS
jgi:hypothetical protein